MPLVAVKAGMLPVPLAARPMAVLLLVQVKVAPAGELTKLDAGTVALTHTVWLGGVVMVGVGLIMYV